MEIKKIKNFNQKVLAIFGSLAIVLLVIAIVWVATEFIRTFGVIDICGDKIGGNP